MTPPLSPYEVKNMKKMNKALLTDILWFYALSFLSFEVLNLIFGEKSNGFYIIFVFLLISFISYSIKNILKPRFLAYISYFLNITFISLFYFFILQ